MKRAVAIPLFLAPAIGVAEPEVINLRLMHEPSPRSLRMRRPVAQVPPPPARPATPMPAAPSVSATQRDPIEEVDGLRDVRQPVSFSLTMGYQVDGARKTDNPSLGGRVPSSGSDYAELRSYGFGEGFLSTRGVGSSALETYFAVRFQAARTITTEPIDDVGSKVDVTSPLATWFSSSGVELRSGWAEAKDFLPKRLGLANLRVRAGSQFVYGPWILHLDGVNVAYEGQTVTAALYGGPRHTDYTRAQTNARPIATGASLRIDLRGLTDAVPIAVAGEYLGLTKSDETGQKAVDTTQLQVDWRPRQDVVVIGQMRGINGDLANQRLELRTRYKQVTNFVFDVTRRLKDDWRWDPALAKASSDTLLDAKRYLDLGPVLPQLIASARAGTLIRENIDLLARIAIASDLLAQAETPNSFTAPYFEFGGAVEVRLRRQVAFALSLLSRQTKREPVPTPIPDMLSVPDTAAFDLNVDGNTLGEQGFTEFGGVLKMTLGARRFSAAAEAYVRNTRYSVLYSDPNPMTPVPTTDQRGGGRVTLDAWVGRKIRVFAQYDVSSQLDTAPEISGYKSLRLTLTGIY